MKSLESKYIDLANYYKKELVTTQGGERPANLRQTQQPISRAQASMGGSIEQTSQNTSAAVGGVVQNLNEREPSSQSLGFSQLPAPVLLADQFGRSEQPVTNQAREDAIISELRNEKMKFE